MAKTHLSLSHDPALKNAPTGFTVTVRDLRPYTGAGWIVALCGDMMTMPGLGKTPAAFAIDIDEIGRDGRAVLAARYARRAAAVRGRRRSPSDTWLGRASRRTAPRRSDTLATREPLTAGCSTAVPAGSSSRPQAAPEISPSACFRPQITQ